MSRHYCTRHPERSRSRYPARLEARGLSKAPRMEPLEPLRRRQLARKHATGFPWRIRAAEVAEP